MGPVRIRGLHGDSVLSQAPQTLDGRHEIIGTGQRLCKSRKRIARAGDYPRHAIEHSRKPLLVCAESNEHGAMVVDISVGHVTTKDVSKLVLIRSNNMRVRWLVLELDAVEFCASHDALLLIDRQGFPRGDVVLPLLQQQD